MVSHKPSYEELERKVHELEKEAHMRNRAEEEALIDEARLRSVLKISQLKTASIRELLDSALHEAIALSESKLGYIYYYSEDRCEFTLHAWSKEVMKECTIPNPPTVYQLEKTGIWGEAVRQRRPIVVNDFLAPNPLKKGYPEGHAHLFRYMTIPVFSGERIVAVVGAANKGTDYTGLDVRQLALMMDSVWKIAERREAEEALLASETRYRVVSDNTYDWEYWVSPEGRLLYTSPSCQRITGYSVSEFEANPKLMSNIVYPDDLPHFESHLKPDQITGGPLELEFRIIHRDGTTRHIGHVCQPVFDENGKFMGRRGSNRDVTKRKRAEESLRESQQMLHSVLDTIPVRVFWKDTDSNYLGCNRPFALDAGLQSPEEIVGRNDFEMGWREQAQLYRSDDRLVIETGRPKLGYEEPQTTPSGDRIWVRTSKVPLFDVKGETKGVLGTYEDITVHKRAEEGLRKAHDELEQRVVERTAELIKVNEALQGEILERSRAEAAVRQSEEKYRQLFETVADAILVFDGETRKFIDVNESALRLYGYTRDEFLGLKHKDITAEPDLSEESINETLAGIRTKVPLRYHRKKDGTVFPVEISASTFDLSGQRVLCGVIRDITERIRAEEAIRQQINFQQTLIDTIPSPVFYKDTEGRYLGCNSSFESYIGLSKADIIGKTVYDVAPRDLADIYREADLALFQSPGIQQYETRVRYADATRHDVLFTKGAFTDLDGKTAGLVGVMFDITDRKRAERELSEYRDHLEDLVRERTEELAITNERLTREIEERKRAEQALKGTSEKFKFFAYSVAHDLKSPAAGVYGLTKRLSKHVRDLLDEKGRAYCDQILKVSEHIASLVEKINIYIATKEAAPLIETTNIAEILRMLRDEFSAQLCLRQIDLLTPESEVKIEADRLSILRIFRNLIDNALKYGGESLTRISIGYEQSESLHIFSVSDNGKGLKEADFEKVFGLFERNETSRGVEGAGLGLTIVKEIAEQHGGRAWVEPRGKKGTTFFVSISKDLPCS